MPAQHFDLMRGEPRADADGVARGWDLSRAGLSKIEAGLRLVIDAEAVVLARVLGVALDELVPKKARGLGAVLRQGRG